MLKYKIHCVVAAVWLLSSVTATSFQTENEALTQAIEKSQKALQRDQIVSDMMLQMGATLRCLLNILDADINEKLYRLWDGNLERVQKEAIFKLTDDQFMDLVYQKVMITLKDMQSIHPQCVVVTYPYNEGPGHNTNKLKASRDMEDLRDFLEGIGSTMKCIQTGDEADPRIHSIYAKCFIRYHGSYDDSKTSLALTALELGRILSELQQLETRCQRVNIERGVETQTIGQPLNALQRDQMISEMMGQMGSTLRCLLNILDSEINEKLNRLWDGNLERVQKEAIFKLTDNQFMDLVYEKAVITLKDMQAIHPECASVTYPYVKKQDHNPNKLKASTDLKDLRDFLEGVGATMKCILTTDKPDPRVHSIFDKCFVRYHGSHDTSKTSLALTKLELGRILSDLKELEDKCQMVGINGDSVQQAKEKPLQALQRDRLIGEMMGQIGSTLRCLLNILDADINEKLNHLWDENLERVQKEAIFKLTDNQFMDLIYEKTVETLKDIQSLHPQCASIPYPCDHPVYTKKLKASKDVKDLRDSLEGIDVTMKCILGNDKLDKRIHRIYAECFVRYHGSTDASETSLVLTKQELGRILADLKKLETNCREVSIGDEPCLRTSSTGNTNVAQGEHRCTLYKP